MRLSGLTHPSTALHRRAEAECTQLHRGCTGAGLPAQGKLPPLYPDPGWVFAMHTTLAFLSLYITLVSNLDYFSAIEIFSPF